MTPSFYDNFVKQKMCLNEDKKFVNIIKNYTDQELYGKFPEN